MSKRFDDFLEQEGLLGHCTAVALKRVIAWQIAQEMKAQNLAKTALAKRMHTSPQTRSPRTPGSLNPAPLKSPDARHQPAP
jgi:hypothetical protein